MLYLLSGNLQIQSSHTYNYLNNHQHNRVVLTWTTTSIVQISSLYTKEFGIFHNACMLVSVWIINWVASVMQVVMKCSIQEVVMLILLCLVQSLLLVLLKLLFVWHWCNADCDRCLPQSSVEYLTKAPVMVQTSSAQIYFSTLKRGSPFSWWGPCLTNENGEWGAHFHGVSKFCNKAS